MNFYHSEVSSRRQIETTTPLAQSTVFEILNLSAALFIDGAEISGIRDLEALDNQKRVLIETIEKFLEEARSTGLRLLELLRVSTSSLVTQVSSMRQFLVDHHQSVEFCESSTDYFIEHLPPEKSHQVLLIRLFYLVCYIKLASSIVGMFRSSFNRYF